MASSDPDIIPVEDEDESSIPDRDTAQKLVEDFASITSTDEALAQFYLQNHKWDLQKSLNAYYESLSTGSTSEGTSRANDDVMVTFDSLLTGVPFEGKISIKPPDNFTLLTWNLDGLDEHNLKRRTKAVIKIIEMEKPDIVFLQEVIPATYSYLEEHLPHYMFIAGGTDNYFIATLIFKTTVYFDGHLLHTFQNSRMGRNILKVDCHIGSLKLRLLNTHLESTNEFSGERKAQLRKAMQLLKSGSKDDASILGGDLNLRDKEAIEVNIPRDVYDLWEYLGQRNECKFTWDALRNSNISIPGKFRPRARFDRVYLHQSDPPSLTPLHFGLVGIQKVAGTQSFPSDHWGIIIRFKILNQKAITSSPPPSHLDVPNNSSSKASCSKDISVESLDISEEPMNIVDPSTSVEVIHEEDEGTASENENSLSSKQRKRSCIELD